MSKPPDASSTPVRPHEHRPCLDGLRGLAAIMVVLGHASDFGLPPLVDGSASHCGVLIFFALSGFLMGDLYLAAPPTRRGIETYAAARIARIVPIYYLVVLASAAIARVDPSFVYAVTPVQLLRLLTFNGSVSVFWSIGPEVQFYLVFVALWLLHGRLRGPPFAGVVLLLAAFGLVTIHRWPGILVLGKIHVFALGMLAALLRRRIAGRLSPTAIAAIHTAALAVLFVFLLPESSERLLGATPFDRQTDPAFTSFYGNLPRVALASFLALAFSFESRIAGLILANPVAALVGRCSFSIYLLHVAIYDTMTRAGLLTPLPGWVGTSAILVLTLLVSAMSYRFIEAPLRTAVRSRLMDLGTGSRAAATLAENVGASGPTPGAAQP